MSAAARALPKWASVVLALMVFGGSARADDGESSFQLKPGEFPPEGTARYIAGELIDVDPYERKFVLRLDRTDGQKRSEFDRPHSAMMLPFGSVYYHGAPAALEDVPLGTHLHGLFYERDREVKTHPVEPFQGRRSTEATFNRCLRLEDDFSHYSRQGKAWKVDKVDLEAKKLAATLHEGGKALGESTEFELLESTRVWKGKGFAGLDALAPGQLIQLNITWATIYGPGRIRDVWADDESRKQASALQLAKHRIYVRLRGLPGWIDAVDNKERILTITFFDNVDPTLIDELEVKQQCGVAVAEENLVTYDPVNDRKRGPVLERLVTAKAPGSSGIQYKLKTDLLLEGYRPARIVRVYPASWPVIALPPEEKLFGR